MSLASLARISGMRGNQQRSQVGPLCSIISSSVWFGFSAEEIFSCTGG